MQKFICDCGNGLFFENTHCLACGREVSWCPCCATMTALEFTDPGMRCVRCSTELWKCANRVDHDICNRSLVAPSPNEMGVNAGAPLLCDCCRYNETIPDLSVEGNLRHWLELEQAKRRLFHGLDGLGLPHGAKADGFDPGLSFDFKGDSISGGGLWRSVGTDEQVFTGHADGKVTVNIREANSVEREKLRVDLGESHRTLIGHFRHEIGHYYWDLLIAKNDALLEGFRGLFGDPENPTYSAALERHYSEGPPANWKDSYISAYATMHPWEDWAETFAFYLNIVDVMETAAASGLVLASPPGNLAWLIDTYSRLGLLVNELNRAIGLMDFQPQVIVPPVIAKLQFVHDVVAGARQSV